MRTLYGILSELPQRALDADVTDLLPFDFSKPTALPLTAQETTGRICQAIVVLLEFHFEVGPEIG